MTGDGAPLRERLRSALPAAMKARNKPVVDALRTALAAIDNAEAIEIDESTAFVVAPTSGLATASGPTEAPRGDLTADQVRELVEREVADRVLAAEGYEAEGFDARGADLRTGAAVLQEHLDAT